MPERRFEHADEVKRHGLSTPDEATMHFLWQIVDEGVLGASRHVKLCNELILHLLESADHGLARAKLVAAFIARTRGHDTPVIGNSLDILLSGIEALPTDEQVPALKVRITQWEIHAAERKEKLVTSAVRQLSDMRGVMAFDYSSTVAVVVTAMAKVREDLVIVVPESRAISGGARYLEEFLPQGLSVSFIPDAAIEYGLAECGVVLFGAETLRADGSFLNTIGSRMIARLARDMDIEVYGATDMLKLDRRSYAGHRPAPVIRHYDSVLKADLKIENLEKVSTNAPELEVIPPHLITGFLTEYGPVPPASIWSIGRELFDVDQDENGGKEA
jgi:translation initiation factor 2B subunit (eIF-2B alpha/beta/delta family)|tara:strand:+ start:487 stop:1479 length:993 start_codon:yes stop_codon:yes gene_type:complete